MSLRVTLNIDGQRKTGDMGRHHQDMDSQGSGPASQALGANPQLVDFFQNL
jgi:hypothetical protein